MLDQKQPWPGKYLASAYNLEKQMREHIIRIFGKYLYNAFNENEEKPQKIPKNIPFFFLVFSTF